MDKNKIVDDALKKTAAQMEMEKEITHSALERIELSIRRAEEKASYITGSRRKKVLIEESGKEKKVPEKV